MNNQLFKTGTTHITQDIHRATKNNPEFAMFIIECENQHKTGYWGNLCDEDRQANNYAVYNNERILSSYEIPKHLNIKNGFDEKEHKIWIITEADRSLTTILFPSEY